MAVYVDDVRHPYGNMIMCHMWADTLDERGEFVISCRDGWHCLDGQRADNGDLVGLHQIIEG